MKFLHKILKQKPIEPQRPTNTEALQLRELGRASVLTQGGFGPLYEATIPPFFQRGA